MVNQLREGALNHLSSVALCCESGPGREGSDECFDASLDYSLTAPIAIPLMMYREKIA